jgi:hypothetical protein
MARTARITKIDRRGARCTLLNYRAAGEKSQVEIPGGMQEFRQWIREQLKDSSETLVAIALAQWLAKNPGSTDFSTIEGKTITLDLEAVASAGLVTIL